MRVVRLPKIYLRNAISLKSGIFRNRCYPLQRSIPSQLSRHIVYTNNLRQDVRPSEPQAQKVQIELPPEQSESIKPEIYQEPKKPGPDPNLNTDALLSEQTVSNKEQRKADWAIMKEMARYLWPTVWTNTPVDAERGLTKLVGRFRGKIQSGDCSCTLGRL